MTTDSTADLLIGNNVLAHVPDLNDFVGGMRLLLKPGGVITMEFPHLMRLISENQWDTIYHEHFSYFSFLQSAASLRRHGLRLFDVEELPTHGGSLRIYGCHTDDSTKPDSAASRSCASASERPARRRSAPTRVRARVEADKRQILAFLIDLKAQGSRSSAMARQQRATRCSTIAGSARDFIDYTCDLNTHKQGHFLPGSHIPIMAPDVLRADRPDVVLILPWNLRTEIVDQLSFIREWGGHFATRTPQLALET